MKFTNIYNLPEVFIDACKVMADEYDKFGDFSVTELCRSPRISALRKFYWQYIEEDITERVWLMLGQAVHDIIAKVNHNQFITEERLIVTIDDYKISMKPDLLSVDGTLSDIKVTSVFSYYSPNIEWKYQLNIYKWGLEQCGYNVNRLQNILILRDWIESRSMTSDDYPHCQIVIKPVEIMDKDEVESFIRNKISLLKDAYNGMLPDCNENDRWYRPGKYKVIKGNNKRATKCFDTKEEAENFIKKEKNKYVIIQQKGQNVRCERNKCGVASFCDQYKYLKERETQNDELYD